MKIDGKALADKILSDLSLEVVKLKKKGVTPTLAVIQVGDDPGSTAYIRQKQKAAERIGAKLILSRQPSPSGLGTRAISLGARDKSYQQLQERIKQENHDPAIHGFIIQQPLPDALGDVATLLNLINPKKDVDGFLPNSPYPVPVAAAVITIFKVKPFDNWLCQKSIVVIGRGETAGKPIADALIKRGCTVSIIHSQTKNPDAIIKSSDIIISCVGKPNIVRRDNIKEGAILVSVGLWRDSQGKLHGDYEEDEIKDVASFYTPTPGGVGPVNVACLMTNLVQAASKLL